MVWMRYMKDKLHEQQNKSGCWALSFYNENLKMSYIEFEKMKNGQRDQVLFGDFQGKNLSPLGPLWVVHRGRKTVLPETGQKGVHHDERKYRRSRPPRS